MGFFIGLNFRRSEEPKGDDKGKRPFSPYPVRYYAEGRKTGRALYLIIGEDVRRKPSGFPSKEE